MISFRRVLVANGGVGFESCNAVVKASIPDGVEKK